MAQTTTNILTPEKKKKLRSKEWRMNHLYKIVDKHGELVRFKMNYEQSVLLERYTKKKKYEIGLREFILKDRQIGITTFHILYYLDEVIFNKNKTAAIIAHEKESLELIFRKAKVALDNMPDYLRPTTKIDNKSEILFSSLNSMIRVALKVRSGTYNYLHVSEIARVREYNELLAGSFSTVPMDGDITCESTGNGLNDFYKSWHKNKESSVWSNHFFSWLEHLEYRSDIKKTRVDHDDYLGDITDEQKNWWYLKLEEHSNDFGLMKQEFPLTEEDAFLHTGKGIFTDELEDIESIEPEEKESNFYVFS